MKDIEQKEVFAKNLNHYLALTNKSQKEVANAIGVSPQTFNTWCQAVALPRMGKVQRLADYFHIGKSNLIDRKENVEPSLESVRNFTTKEYEHIEKYRSLDSYGKETIDIALTREAERTKLLSEMGHRITELDNHIAEKDARIAELESKPTNVIEFSQYSEGLKKRMTDYYHSTSAGTGVYIMGNEAVDQIPIPDTLENRSVDYAIQVSGDSMEPEFHDGDTALVSRKSELSHGDIGIFIVNGNAFIKEYGEHELISYNPEYDNIKISEYDNIVCIGKVVGKL